MTADLSAHMNITLYSVETTGMLQLLSDLWRERFKNAQNVARNFQIYYLCYISCKSKI